MPTGNPAAEPVTEATPDALSGTVAMVPAGEEKVTLPVGVPVPVVFLTVAVRVVLPFTGMLFGLIARVVVVGDLDPASTVSVSDLEEAEYCKSPE